MERRRKKPKVSYNKRFKSPNHKTVNIGDLPEEILIKIFGYLECQELCQVGKVSKRWHTISRCSDLWRRVDVHISPKKCKPMSIAAVQFVHMLPPWVTHLKLSFEYSKAWALKIRELSEILSIMCPHLQVLILHRARLVIKNNNHLTSDMNACIKLMKHIDVLAFHHCHFIDNSVLPYDYGPPIWGSDNTVLAARSHFDTLKDDPSWKIKVLDFSRSTGLSFHLSNVPRLTCLRLAGFGIEYDSSDDPSVLPRLEILDLEGTLAGSRTFEAIRNKAFQLVELYMCFTQLKDDDLIFSNLAGALPNLKKICLRCTFVTSRGIISLLKYCKSLQHICAGDLVPAEGNDYAMCNSEKVHVIHGSEYCDHYSKVDYMHA